MLLFQVAQTISKEIGFLILQKFSQKLANTFNKDPKH